MFPFYTRSGFVIILLGILVSQPRVLVVVQAQGNNYVNEYTWGTLAATNTICFSDSINVWSLIRIASKVFSFTPATAITFIRCWNNLPLHPFMATVTSGGVGSTALTTISLGSYHHGKLVVQCQVYCT
ncbi:uncharacterized protein LOC131434562 [Malaya genurostris]|uniref:uncharacterized protein LOC131434562 n=1 Tax=Malaya genurostris TaxID=325434 RepID=UPI0026F3B2B3|nr:uncharacterized protein LOC131434562 [Malaya genurostris]